MLRSAATLAVGLVLSGCSVIGDDPEDPSLPPVFGARVTDGRLQLSTGTPCQNVSRIVVNFNPGSARLILEPAQGASADVETLTVGGPYPGMEIVEDLPVGFDWKAEQQVLMTVDSEPAGAGATPTSIAELTAGSGDHPTDSYYFEGVGWLGPAEVAEGNGTSLLTVCTPDPAAP